MLLLFFILAILFFFFLERIPPLQKGPATGENKLEDPIFIQ